MNVENKIKKCSLCGDLPKLTYNSIKQGNCNILILGESPAKDGWIQSGKAFYNAQGKLQATGRILQKLLEICNISIDNISFTECCKCIIEDRTQLRKCIHNCQPILLEQISKIDCDIILPMGQYPTEAILNTKIKRLKDYIGKIFPIKIYNKLKVVIPIYHTSPANPLGYKGNVAIFEKLKDYFKLKENITITPSEDKIKQKLFKSFERETAHPDID